MNYKQIQPIESLKSYVRYFGIMKNNESFDQTKNFRVIADGCPGLIFQENPDAFLQQKKIKLHQLFLHGLTTSHSEKTAKGKYCNLGVYFQPNAVKSIFGIDANELTNSYIDLSDIIKNDLSEKLLQEKRIEKRIEILSDFICLQIKKNKHHENPKVTYGIARINTENNDDLNKIQSKLNISERSLERIFKSNVGISPKLFFRICRFQAALDFLRQQTYSSFTKIAYQHSYADQSHFIREFKEFTGANPKQFLLQANEQAINFPEWKS